MVERAGARKLPLTGQLTAEVEAVGGTVGALDYSADTPKLQGKRRPIVVATPTPFLFTWNNYIPRTARRHKLASLHINEAFTE